MSKENDLPIDDHALWQRLCADVRPLNHDATIKVADIQHKISEDAPLTVSKQPRDRLFSTTDSFASFQAEDLLKPQMKNWQQKRYAQPLSEKPQTFADLDGRRAQRFRSGKMKPDAILDMHGMTEREAAVAFGHFFERALQKKQRNLLVITGKGSGVLHRALAGWLERGNVRVHLAGVSAMPHHKGGSGAYGLYLKK